MATSTIESLHSALRINPTRAWTDTQGKLSKKSFHPYHSLTVPKAQDLAGAIAKWEADRRILQAAAGWDLSLNDQQFALLKMCPREIRRELMKEFKADAVTGIHNFPSYVSLKQRIMQLAHREIQETRKPLYAMSEAWSGSACEKAEDQEHIPDELVHMGPVRRQH